MVDITSEMRELAKAAATAYVTGIKFNNMEDSIDSFLDAYDHAIKKIWLREHKNAAMKDLISNNDKN
jgi:hypothetical protein